MTDKNIINEELNKFSVIFKDEESCLRFLDKYKWENGFLCPHCGNNNYCKGKKYLSRRCTRCKKEISPTAHTLFHHCRIPLKTAFKIVYLSCKFPDISSYEMNNILGIRRMTCYHFQKKVKNCMNFGKDDPLLNKILEI